MGINEFVNFMNIMRKRPQTRAKTSNWVLTCCQTYTRIQIEMLPNNLGTEESYDSDTIRTGGLDQVRGMHAYPTTKKERQNILLRITPKRRNCEGGIHRSRVEDTQYHNRSSTRETSQNKIKAGFPQPLNNFVAANSPLTDWTPCKSEPSSTLLILIIQNLARFCKVRYEKGMGMR